MCVLLLINKKVSLNSTFAMFNGQLCLLVSHPVTVKTVGIFYVVYFHVPYDSDNENRLFPYTTHGIIRLVIIMYFLK
jgi:hypothetical protein